MESKKGLSVILCCYNSASRLPETLKHLASQKIDYSIPWEVIIVNNASTDNTVATARIEWSKYTLLKKPELKIVDEDRPGLTNARKTGVEASTFEYIIFCDDDNWLDEFYLQRSFKIMEENSNIGVLGGHNVGVSDVSFPEWWESYQECYAVGKQAEKTGDITERLMVWGAGMVSRKSLLSKVLDKKFPSLLVGRKGEELSSGEDVEICIRIVLLGYKLYYDDSLILKHFMPANRLTWAYKEKLIRGHVASSQVLTVYKSLVQSKGVKWSYKLKKLVKGIACILLIKVKIIQRDIQPYYRDLYANWRFSFLPFDNMTKQIIKFEKKMK